jgi:hypothetical protein
VTPAQPTPIAESTPFDSWQRPLATAPNVEAVVLSIVARLTGDGRMDPAWSFLGEGFLDLESNQGAIADFGASECIEDRTERELDLCCVDGLRLSAEQLTLQALEFEQDEWVELAVLLSLVLDPLTSLCLKIVGATNAGEFGFERSDTRPAFLRRRVLRHRSCSAVSIERGVVRKAFARPSLLADCIRFLRDGSSMPSRINASSRASITTDVAPLAAAGMRNTPHVNRLYKMQ